MSGRRQLEFTHVGEIMPEVDRLAAGHRTVGRWSLGAICDHLARSIGLTLDLAPSDAPPTREQSVTRRLFFRASGFPEGQSPPFAAQSPDPDADLAATSEALRRGLAALQAHRVPFPSHPILGPMTREEWLIFHSRHAAHHLSFAIPTRPDDSGADPTED